jgi:tetratricopeptide (TPR) repeat protein
MNRHFGREALLRLLSGLGDEDERVEAIRHVARCRRCLGSAAGYLLGGGRTEARNTLALFVEAEVRESVDTLKARGWWAEIRELSPAEQIRKIRSTAALQSLPVFEVILEDARTTGRSDPFVGESLIQAAWTLVDLLPEARYSKARKNDLRGQALTAAANCRRIAAEFAASAQAIEAAKRYLAQGTSDPASEARLLSIHCSLCSDIGEFEAALTYVRDAVVIFRDLEDSQSVAHNTVKEANCLLAAYQPAEAIERARFALDHMPPKELRLEVLAKLIIVESLVILERPLEALFHFMEAHSLCEQASSGTRLLALHCEARLLDALGCVRESEKLFRHTIKAFFEQEIYRDAFISLLTLFECLCRRGALGKAAAVCEEAIAATSEAGEACNEQIRHTWVELLAVVRVRQLSESELVQARQYLVRNWSVPKGVFVLPRLETLAPAPSTPFPASLETPPVPAAEEMSPASFRTAREEYDRRLIEAAMQEPEATFERPAASSGSPVTGSGRSCASMACGRARIIHRQLGP